MRMTAPAAERTVVSDDGREIRLTLYAGAETVAGMTLPPQRAVSLAGELIAAAARRLDAALAPREDLSPQRRGGDPRRHKRAERDNALRALDALLGADLPLEQRARQIIFRVGRYHPTGSDKQASEERRALHQITVTGLPVPGLRQVKRILARA